MQIQSPFKYISHHLSEDGEDGKVQVISAKLQLNNKAIAIRGRGNGPIDAFLNALDLGVRVHHYEERSLFLRTMSGWGDRVLPA